MRLTLFVNKHWKSLLWAAFILIACSMPPSQAERFRFITIPYFDKFVHLSLYAIFTLLLISENNRKKFANGMTAKSVVIAASISLPYGILVEAIQYFVLTTRSAELMDVLANTLGFIIAALSYRWANRITDGFI